MVGAVLSCRAEFNDGTRFGFRSAEDDSDEGSGGCGKDGRGGVARAGVRRVSIREPGIVWTGDDERDGISCAKQSNDRPERR